jgi:hypothetical protein
LEVFGGAEVLLPLFVAQVNILLARGDIYLGDAVLWLNAQEGKLRRENFAIVVNQESPLPLVEWGDAVGNIVKVWG